MISEATSAKQADIITLCLVPQKELPTNKTSSLHKNIYNIQGDYK
jgi:hypothetical protein